ncbi:gustatory and pheromone receptor 39a-like [Drosophila ficusphila]|uniref:gustatory and pheromone receptor 39a-like n=1 Tax=Drosophila ficusphila TaxID=30025 RepID=UPI0007E67566|nr:gustatory and pheromone receptor 39a-like [Drosophila ficusphila]
MSRNAFKELRVQLRTMRWLGVLRFSINFEKSLVREDAFEQRCSWLYLVAVLGITCSLIVYSFYFPGHFVIGRHNSTGNCYALINFRSCCVVTLLVYIQLYMRRCRFASLLQSMLRCNRIYESSRGALSSVFPYFLHLTLFLACMLNYAYGYWAAGVRLATIPIYLLQYGFSYLVLGQLVVLFVHCQRILLSTLEHYNQLFLKGLESCKESCVFYEIFRKYNQVMWLSHEEVNQCFGMLLLPITGFILLITPAGPFYLVSTIFEGRHMQNWRFVFMSSTAVFWSLPWVALLVLAMGMNGIQKEVSNLLYPFKRIT